MNPKRFSDHSFYAARESAPAALIPQCFADEIAIDFPSLDRLIERERDAFLGDHDAPLFTTEVSVSTREAWLGTIVPLEVPLRGTCRLCGGRGETWTEPCDACSGTGDSLLHHSVQLALPARIADGARLRFQLRSPHAAPVRIEVRVAIKTSAA